VAMGVEGGWMECALFSVGIGSVCLVVGCLLVGVGGHRCVCL